MSEKMHRAVDTAVSNNQSMREMARSMRLSGPERAEFIQDPEIENTAIDIASASAVSNLLQDPERFDRLMGMSSTDIMGLVHDSEASGLISTDGFEAYVQNNLACTVDPSSGNAITTLGRSSERVISSLGDMPGVGFDAAADQLHDKFTPDAVISRAKRVNDKVNRAMQIVANNTELFATPFSRMDTAQQNSVMRLISNAGLSPNQVKDMHDAATRIESGSEARESAQAQIDSLKSQIKDAKNRGDKSLEDSLRAKRDNLKARRDNLGDRHLNILRDKLVAQEVAMLSKDAEDIPLNHNQVAELGTAVDEPYNSDDTDPTTPENTRERRNGLRRAMTAILGAGGLAVAAYAGFKWGYHNDTGEQFNNALAHGGAGLGVAGRVVARVDSFGKNIWDAINVTGGRGFVASVRGVLNAVNPFGDGGDSYLRFIKDQSNPGVVRDWLQNFGRMDALAKAHPNDWVPRLRNAADMDKIRLGKEAAIDLSRRVANHIGHRALH